MLSSSVKRSRGGALDELSFFLIIGVWLGTCCSGKKRKLLFSGHFNNVTSIIWCIHGTSWWHIIILWCSRWYWRDVTSWKWRRDFYIKKLWLSPCTKLYFSKVCVGGENTVGRWGKRLGRRWRQNSWEVGYKGVVIGKSWPTTKTALISKMGIFSDKIGRGGGGDQTNWIPWPFYRLKWC